ncbi:hypothetical protein FQR65_LT11980 [Abscondita terminalis]|nr:hypothetical protein FQR65_LT11980 [Abscondita terminalis]
MEGAAALAMVQPPPILPPPTPSIPIDYWETYGYLDTTETESLSLSSKNFSTLQFGLNKFQEFYNLTITTTLDEATKKLMKSPRCGVADIVSYNVRKTFWKLDVVKWNFPGGTNKQLSVAQAAFNLWEKYGNIKFEHSFANPNIIISFKRRDHLKDTTRQRCPYSFEDDVLGHAFFPLSDNSVAAEVHINIILCVLFEQCGCCKTKTRDNIYLSVK